MDLFLEDNRGENRPKGHFQTWNFFCLRPSPKYLYPFALLSLVSKMVSEFLRKDMNKTSSYLRIMVEFCLREICVFLDSNFEPVPIRNHWSILEKIHPYIEIRDFTDL